MPSNSAAGELAVAEQVVVQEIEMPPGQPLDLGQRRIDGLRVERSAAFEERLLVTEVADVRTAARDDDGVGDEIALPLDQIAPDRRHAVERPHRAIGRRAPGGRALKSSRNRGQVSSPGPRKIVSACGSGLVGQRGHVQSAEDDVAPRAR